MKKIFRNIILFGTCILGMYSCSESDYEIENLVPDQYHKVLYFKNDGVSTLSLSTTQTNYKDSILIIKAGSDPSLTANVDVKLLSQAEVDEAYPNSHYKVLPSSCFSLDDDTKVLFGESERHKYFHFTIHADQVYKMKGENDVMVLPFKLCSDNDTINLNKNYIYYKFDIRIPVISIIGNADETMIYKNLKFNMQASMKYIDINKWEVTSNIAVPDNAQSLVEEYNASKKLDYELLPKGTYTLPENFKFAKESMETSAEISINRNGLVSDKTYLLPIQLTTTSMGDQMQANTEIHYIVIHNPKYGYEVPNRSNWKIVFCNEDGLHTDIDTPIGNGAPAIIDDNPATDWLYGRPNNYNTDYENHDDYDYSFKDYHAFFGDRIKSGSQAIVIDMKETKNVVGIGILESSRNDDFKNCYIINCAFSVSNDPEFKFIPLKNGGNIDDYSNLSLNKWSSIFTWNNMPQNGNFNWKDVSDDVKAVGGVKGRFLKINILKGTFGGSNQGSRISELKIKHLVAIDGEAIK